MKLKIIIVEPKYQMNVGYIARVSKNFGIKKLSFVSPRADLNGKKSVMFAKHAVELLNDARIYKSFDDAVKDCDITIGTTGIWRKSKANFKRVFLLDKAIERVEKIGKPNSVVGLIIGRDDIGLTPSEIERCDIIAYIGTNDEYPVLNISHALAIMLYAMTKSGFSSIGKTILQEKPNRKELAYLFKTFDSIIERKKIRNRKAVKSVFRRLIYNSQPSQQELHALITALK